MKYVSDIFLDAVPIATRYRDCESMLQTRTDNDLMVRPAVIHAGLIHVVESRLKYESIRRACNM